MIDATMGNSKRDATRPTIRLVTLLLLAYAANAQMREGFAPVPGARIFYRDSGGNGTAVVLLHSASGTNEVWEHQVSAFALSGYRVIAYDRRGWGRSTDDPGNDKPWTATGDLLALVDDLGIERFHLVATALGGYVGFDFALSHPERLRSLVIANSLGGLQDEQLLDLGRRLRPQGFDGLPPDFRELGPAFRAADPVGVQRWLEYEKNSRHNAQSSTPLQHRLTLAILETIQSPVLLLTGGADLYAPPALQNKFAAHIKHSETAVVPDAGHSVFWEQPTAFNRLVLAFLSKH